VQAALTGDSAAFDARGRVLAWMSGSQHGVIPVRLTLPMTSSKTIYDRLGDYVPWTAVGIAVLFGFAPLAGWMRRRSHSGGKGGAVGGDEADYDAGTGLHVPG
jgi:apolipoprotein N-acyltransferase